MIKVLLFLSLFFGLSPAYATTLFAPGKSLPLEETLERLTHGSDLIVVGKVTQVSGEADLAPAWFPAGTPWIVSTVGVEIQQVFKGDRRKKAITVQVPGGCIEETGECLRIGIFPNFSSQEPVLLFLRRHEGAYRLSDALKGKQSPSPEKAGLVKEITERQREVRP